MPENIVMRQILCIEDNNEMGLILEGALGKDYICTLAQDIQQAKKYLENEVFDLMTLDLNLPDGDGLKFLEDVSHHPKWKNIPVFVLTADNQISQKVKAFSIGAEDYIVKPIDPIELNARVKSKFKRIEKNIDSQDLIKFGDLLIFISKQKVILAQEEQTELDLTSLELRLLINFVKSKGTVLSRDFLLEEIWGHNMHVSNRTVDTHIGHLRKKIARSTVTIQTVVGEGYRISL
jgi:two-component system alkaline phosphatase synthesis response regulator PhoP